MKKLTVFLLLGFLIITGLSLSGCAAYDKMVLSAFSPPEVISVSPAANQTNVALNTKVKVAFNEAMDTLSFNPNTFKLYSPSGRVQGNVHYNTNSITNNIAVFTPNKPLSPNTEYIAELTSGIKTNLEIHIKEYKWKFTTGK
jgi:hypothetical protein